MTKRRASITVEFDWPNMHTLAEVAGLVLHQMKARPVWDEPAGTGALNHVCYDSTLRITKAEELS